ncbi:hypothetical protein RFI_38495, partial [Reticulomyxa filosa]
IGMYTILAWSDKNIDGSVMDFIINNNLQIMNSSPFEHTYEKDGAQSSIDITLCSESISRWCNNWRTEKSRDKKLKHGNFAVESWTNCVEEAKQSIGNKDYLEEASSNQSKRKLRNKNI